MGKVKGRNNEVADTQVYLAEDISRKLNLGRSTAYDFLGQVYQKQEPFRVVKIGKLYRVPKKSFDDWLNTV